MQIIGLDFGNCFSFPCYIREDDMGDTRLGGQPRDLIPHDRNYGYPSVFFYSKKKCDEAKNNGSTPPPWCGFGAVVGRASPEKNRIRNLKRHIGKPLVIDDWNKSYDDAIVEVIQYVVRQANKVLSEDILETTNKISISYPATFTRAKCDRLKELAQQAELEDGRKVEVVGMIAEPAAAALDYMVVKDMGNREATVLTFDLGGGTFDLAVVSAFPAGKRRENGDIYYFDIERTGGLEIGGTDFDTVMGKIIQSKLTAGQAISSGVLQRLTETAKLELTDDTITTVSVMLTNGDEAEITVTRQEFEKACEDLVNRMIDETRKILNVGIGKRPEMIILTGGASQMPMIRKAIENAFPRFMGKIDMYRPSRAIAYGAARFISNPKFVGDRLPHDIGVVLRNPDNDVSEFVLYLKKGTLIPCSSKEIGSSVRMDNLTGSTFRVLEAKSDTYDIQELNRDFNQIYSLNLTYPPAKKDTPHLSTLSVNRLGLLTVKAWDPSDSSVKVEAKLQLKL